MDKKIEPKAPTAQFEEAYAKAGRLPEGVVLQHSTDCREQLVDWGFFHLTIPEAAELAAIDMWFSGAITGVDEPDGFDGNPNNPVLKGLLSEHIEQLTQRMLKSVYSGLLTPDLITRDLDDNILPEETFISYDVLNNWLEGRRYTMGDAASEWLDLQLERAGALLYEVKFYRTATKVEIQEIESARFHAECATEMGQDPKGGLQNAYKAAIVENHRLRQALVSPKENHPAKVDRPITTRQRRTLLTIIAALCDYSAIKSGARGAAGQIAAMTDEVGASITAETIAELLKEIPEALETRMK